MSNSRTLTGCSHLHGMAVEKPRKNRKKKHLDRLTRDAIAAQEAGMSYGKYKALHPHTPEEDDEETETEDGARKKRSPLPFVFDTDENIRTCAQCGQSFAVDPRRPAKKYCSQKCCAKHSNDARAERRRRNNPGITVACRICGKDFVTAAHNRIYCSTECYAESMRRRNRERWEQEKERLKKGGQRNGSN